jgi:hypothetical protein
VSGALVKREGGLLRASWIAMLVTGAAVLGFGLVVVALPASDPSTRAIGAASIGMGLFGSAITLTGFRHGRRWAWWCLWYYPIFWGAHLVLGLPPGNDHIHQVVFIALSAAALLLPWRKFFS